MEGKQTANKKILMSGNEAIAEAAIRAGCGFYAGYPITPQNELIAYMARRMREEKRSFVQAESEIAAINMVFGAAAAGVRAMTSSSSPGISLKQEGISYIAGCELPAVIVNVMRGGPGLGNIALSQSDYFQATKGGGHGDYHSIVLAPSSVQEAFNVTFHAFDLADRYRIPVMILLDAFIGQMGEAVALTFPQKQNFIAKPWALTGAKGRKPNVIKSFFMQDGFLEEHNLMLQEKYARIKAKEKVYEAIKTEDAEILFVAYGTSFRIARAVAGHLKEQGIKAGVFRPITLWPFPGEDLKERAQGKKGVFVFELSEGQMVEDVRLAIEGSVPVHFYGRMGGAVFTEEELMGFVKSKI